MKTKRIKMNHAGDVDDEIDTMGENRISQLDFRTMETKRVKTNCGGDVDNETDTMGENRISQLRDSLIHQIFSFIWLE